MLWYIFIVLALIYLVARLMAGNRDEIVYQGRAFATENRMVHYSTDSRTVFVVFPRELPGLGLSLTATVPLDTARAITSVTPVEVTVSKRRHGAPRVTSLTVI